MSSSTASTTCHRTFTTTATPLPLPLRESDSFFHPPPLPICLFKSTMRIPKKPVSFCLSFFSPHLSHPFFPRITFLAPSYLLFSPKGKATPLGGLYLSSHCFLIFFFFFFLFLMISMIWFYKILNVYRCFFFLLEFEFEFG